MASRYRKYTPETGKLIRHKIWNGGRKALGHMNQLNDNWNRNVNRELTRMNSGLRLHSTLIGNLSKLIGSVMQAQGAPANDGKQKLNS